jgi:hypothetical protein
MTFTWREIVRELAETDAMIREDVTNERSGDVTVELTVPGAASESRVRLEEKRGDGWRTGWQTFGSSSLWRVPAGLLLMRL